MNSLCSPATVRVIVLFCKGRDCGLSTDLALVLRSAASNCAEGVLQKGYLKVPHQQQEGAEQAEWTSVPVQVSRDKLIVSRDGKVQRKDKGSL